MRIWVIMGGWASEREVSLESGRAVAEALRQKGHQVYAYELGEGRFLQGESTPDEVLDRLIAPGGEAGEKGPGGQVGQPPRWAGRLLSAADALKDRADVAFLALHGGVGEDGTIQALLDAAGFPYTGSGPTASGIAMDKCLTKLLMQAIGVPTPLWTLVPAPAPGSRPASPDILRETPVGGLPVVVKPIREGSSVGVTIVMRPEEWAPALQAGAATVGDPEGRSGQLLVEKYIGGRELTVGILDRRVLPVVEIRPHEGFYDYRNKYSPGHTSYEVPARLTGGAEHILNDSAGRLVETLGCRGMARVDFRLPPDGDPLCLEVNTIPGLTGTSLLPKAAQAVGIGFPEMLEIVCRAALGRGGAR